MTLMYKSNDCLLLDHNEFISKISKTSDKSFELQRRLFCIVDEKSAKSNRKRNINSNSAHEEAMAIRIAYCQFFDNIPAEIKLNIRKRCKDIDIASVRDLAKSLFETTVFDHAGISGGNNSDVTLQCKVKDEYFLIPPQSRFFCGCVKEHCQKLADNKYDILIADPPWWNKFIRRLKSANEKLSYSMMYNEDIASIPVQNLLSNNCLVAVWCTNAESNITAVKNLIFPSWGVEYIATWYWLKVTTDLEPICNFSAGCRKQPYERVILGKVGDVKDVPDHQLIVSVPSALHSHKPPLLDILCQYTVTKHPQILELFARYLMPNTTSVGFEPLKWQHLSLYHNIS